MECSFCCCFFYKFQFEEKVLAQDTLRIVVLGSCPDPGTLGAARLLSVAGAVVTGEAGSTFHHPHLSHKDSHNQSIKPFQSINQPRGESINQSTLTISYDVQRIFLKVCFSLCASLNRSYTPGPLGPIWILPWKELIFINNSVPFKNMLLKRISAHNNVTLLI